MGGDLIVLFPAAPTITDAACSLSTKISFTGAKVRFGAMSAQASGTIDASGITLTSGTLTTPPGWGWGSVTLGRDGLFAPFSGDALGHLTGSASVAGVPFANLSGWQGGTDLVFSSGDGSQHIEITSDASKGGADLNITGEANLSTGAYDLKAAATGVGQFLGAPLILTGSLTTNGSGSRPSFSLTSTLASQSLTHELTLGRFTVTWDGSDVDGTGALTYAAGNTKLTWTTELDYVSAANWTLAIGESGSPWKVARGLTIPGSGFRGTLKPDGKSYLFDLTADLAGDTWSPVTAGSGASLALNQFTFKATNACGAKANPPCDVTIDASGGLALNINGTKLAADVSGDLDPKTGALTISAALGKPIPLAPKLALSKPTFNLTSTGAADSSPRIALDTHVNTLGVTAPFTLAFQDGGVVGSGVLGSVEPIPGVTLPQVNVGISSFHGSFTPSFPTTGIQFPRAQGGRPPGGGGTSAGGGSATGGIPLSPWAPVIAAPFTIPSSAAAALPRDLHSGVALIGLGETDQQIDVGLPVPKNWYLVGSATSATRLQPTAVALRLDHHGSEVSINVTADAQLDLYANSPKDHATLDLDLAGAIDAGEEGAQVTGSLSLSSPGGWKDAFGMKGLTLDELTAQLGVSEAGPTLGLSATAELPSAIRGPLGMNAKTVVTATADLAETSPCIALGMVAPKGSHALDLDAGAIVADSAQISIAPTGCTVGNVTVAPGFSLHFAGDILAVPVSVSAQFEETPFVLDADIDLGTFNVDGVHLDQTKAHLYIAPNDVDVSLSGGVVIGSDKISVSGEFSEKDAVTELKLKGTADRLEIAPAVVLTKNRAAIDVESGPKGVTADFSLASDVDLLGTTEKFAFEATFANGILHTLDGTSDTTIKVAETTLDGDFRFAYTAGKAPTIKAVVDITTRTGRLAEVDLEVDGDGATLTSDYNLRGVFDATLSGSLVTGHTDSAAPIKVRNAAGKMVDGKPGDYSLSVDGVDATFDGISADGSVFIGDVGSDFYVDFDAKVTLGLPHSPSANVSGSIESNGDFSLTGSESLTLSGFSIDSTVTVSRTKREVSVKAKGSVDVPDILTAKLDGTFSRTAKGGTLYDLSGKATPTLGVNSGKLSFELSNEPGKAGLRADFTLKAGSTIDSTGKLVVTPAGLYSFSAHDKIHVAGDTLKADISLTNCKTTKCKRAGTTDISVSGTLKTSGFTFDLSSDVKSNGHFSARLKISETCRYDTIDVKIAKVWGKACFHLKVSVSNKHIGGVSLHGSAEAEYKLAGGHWRGVGVDLSGSAKHGKVHLTVSGKVLGVRFQLHL